MRRKNSSREAAENFIFSALWCLALVEYQGMSVMVLYHIFPERSRRGIDEIEFSSFFMTEHFIT